MCENAAKTQHLTGESTPTPRTTPLKASVLQIAVVANHQQGKDTRVRLVKVFADTELTLMEDCGVGGTKEVGEAEAVVPFTSLEFKIYSSVR